MVKRSSKRVVFNENVMSIINAIFILVNYILN